MADLTEVSGSARKETPEDVGRGVILWFPLWFPPSYEEIITKDPGQIAEHLADRGYHVKMVCYSIGGGCDTPHNLGKAHIETLECRGRVVRHLGIPFFLYLFRNRRSIDCLILYFPSLLNVFASVLFRLLNRKGVCIVKMDSDGRLYRSSWYIMKQFGDKERGIYYGAVAYRPRLLKRAVSRVVGEARFRILSWTLDLLIIESPEARQRVLETHPWLRRKLVVLPNGVNVKRFGELSESRESERKKMILFVGRIEYAKGIDLIIAAFSRLKDKYPDWTLELVGEISPLFQSQVKDLTTRDLESRIKLMGPLYGTELAGKYRSSKIFCFASRSESFGIALIEAMYLGNAVISSDVGAASYILDYGNAGLIFEPENVDQLTTCLDRLMGDEAYRSRLARAAKIRCEETFSWQKICGDLDSYIRSIIFKTGRQGQ